MSYETAARRANGTYWGDAFYEEIDDSARQELDNDIISSFRYRKSSKGIVVSLLEAIEELTDDRADRDYWRDRFPELKADYTAVGAEFAYADREYEKAFRTASIRDEEIIARRNQ